jgi:hypothetical protein
VQPKRLRYPRSNGNAGRPAFVRRGKRGWRNLRLCRFR